jgi:hypothetical protein
MNIKSKRLLSALGLSVGAPVGVDLARGIKFVPAEDLTRSEAMQDLILPAGATLYNQLGDMLSHSASIPKEVSIPSMLLGLGGIGAAIPRNKKIISLPSKTLTKAPVAIKVEKSSLQPKKFSTSDILLGAGAGAGSALIINRLLNSNKDY